MARFLGVAFGFLAVVLLQCATAQTVHVVGDNIGWNIPAGGAQAYTNWANSKNFVVGDILSKSPASSSLHHNQHLVSMSTRKTLDRLTCIRVAEISSS